MIEPTSVDTVMSFQKHRLSNCTSDSIHNDTISIHHNILDDDINVLFQLHILRENLN